MYGLYLAASGAASQLMALSSTAQNLANISTPGYRRRYMPIEAVSGELSPYEFAVLPAEPILTSQQGRLHRTDNPLDIAITGPGWLAVEMQDNQEAYTRNGELAVGPDGTLIAAGLPVVSVNGGNIKLPAGPITVSQDGWVSVNGLPQAKLKIADSTGVTMVAVGDSLYRPADGSTLPAMLSGSSVEQMYLEMPQDSPITTMVEIIEQNRSYEAAMRAVYAIDSQVQKSTQIFTFNA